MSPFIGPSIALCLTSCCTLYYRQLKGGYSQEDGVVVGALSLRHKVDKSQAWNAGIQECSDLPMQDQDFSCLTMKLARPFWVRRRVVWRATRAASTFIGWARSLIRCTWSGKIGKTEDWWTGAVQVQKWTVILTWFLDGIRFFFQLELQWRQGATLF